MIGPAVYKAVVHTPDHHRQQITQSNSPASLLLTGLYGHDSGRAAVYRVVLSCTCYRCVDLSCERDGTTGNAIELPFFRRSIISESTYLEKTPTAQLTRIGAADRLFSVPLTRITSVPECAVSSVGFLWGSAAVSLSCGVSVGCQRPPNPDDHFAGNSASPERPARLR
jgi:hypothetical protein